MSSTRRTYVACLAVSLLAAPGCEDVVVNTVGTSALQISPAAASLAIGDTARFTASVLSSDGVPLAGREVEWRSLQPAIARVDDGGLVRALATGHAVIRATAEGVSADAAVTVTAPPRIHVSRTTVTFSAVSGGPDPAQQTVAVANSGGGTLNRLSRSVVYASGQRQGWLDTDLSSSTAPATLTLRARTGGLEEGTYTATVRVASAVAGSGTANVVVTFAIAGAAVSGSRPAVPDGVSATPISSSQVRLSWQPPGGQTHYELRRRTGTGGGWSFSASVQGSATSYLDSGLGAGTTYQYQVRACAGTRCSDYSSPVTATTAG
jgi:predicted phage tail protein